VKNNLPNKRIVVAIITLFVLAVILGTHYRNAKKRDILKNIVLASGEITNYQKVRKSSGIFFDYNLKLGDVIYQERVRCEGIKLSCGNKFIGKHFPIVYSDLNPEYNEMLITPYQFEEFNLTFPDSLQWVLVQCGN
jgi:hypothetical protein